ncbi:MAG: 30S ribosomal protein S13 [Nitrospinota bacterium]
MARIAGIDLPKEKRIEIALTYIFGVGRVLAGEVLKKTNVDPGRRVKDLSEKEIGMLKEVLEADYRIEGDLRKDISYNIKRLMDIGAYRGMRHKRSLPVNGQRTKTNARTRKGPKKTVGAKKKA